MTTLRRFWNFTRSLSPLQWAYAVVGLVVALVLFLGISYVWDYTNSAPFCGGACHTMPAHYESYQRSPHARVQCTECHIGRTFIGVAFTRKAVDVQFVFAYITGRYEYPIFAKGLQPAPESCEKCHWPQKFGWDKVVVLAEFQQDVKSTEFDTTLVMKIGGGSERAGLGRGIHWHIENPINFKYSDDLQQKIPYIEVTNADGSKTVYTDIENPLAPGQLAKLPNRQMDCIDCHNRVSHTFISPEQAVDTQLKNKIIDIGIPEIMKMGVEVLKPQYDTVDEANKAIARLDDFYKLKYSDYYAKNTAKLQSVIKTLQTLYPQVHYTEQKLDWNTHPDNLGHKNWPGCFRCHDGKHFTVDRKQAIRLECNLCHAIPEVSTPGGAAPVLALTSPDEPASHKTTTWLAEHRLSFNTSCQLCHDTNNAGGKDNSSFCANSACHGTKWKFVGLDAPKLAELVPAPVRPVSAPNAPPRIIPHPVGGNPDCMICHGPNAKVFPYPGDHNDRPVATCLGCHKSTLPPTSAVAPAPGSALGGPPRIPHSTAGRTQCLGCHGTGVAGVPQVATFHIDFGFTNNNCLTCHRTTNPSDITPSPQPRATPVPTVRPTTAPASASSSVSSAASSASSASISSAPASSASTKTSSSASSASASGPPKLPASHAGRTAGCTACHASGVGGATKPLASVHASFTDDSSCNMCHK